MEISKIHWIGIVVGIGTIVSALIFFLNTIYLLIIVGIGIIIAVTPFVFSIVYEGKVENEKEEMFLEFSRNLVESVKTGNPISRSIINVKDKNYGVLSPHIKKLSNQIYLGIPLGSALQVFSKDVKNKTISRAITLIGQAEKSGGDIGQILEAVAGAVSTSDKLKKERKAVISTLVIQGYIIFFVFIVIILIMQFKIIPLIANVGAGGLGDSGIGASQASTSQLDVANAFFYLLLIQGFFSGLAIGKLAEKNIKAGVKHSFILMMMAFVISSGAKLFI